MEGVFFWKKKKVCTFNFRNFLSHGPSPMERLFYTKKELVKFMPFKVNLVKCYHWNFNFPHIFKTNFCFARK